MTMMMQTVTVQLPAETVRRYQRGAAAAHKPVEEFIAERLEEAAPPASDHLSADLQAELAQLENLDDDALWATAQKQLSPEQERLYTRLRTKNSRGTLSPAEQVTLTAIGDEARRLTLLKSHAFMLLQWRGHPLPPPDSLATLE